MDENSLPRGVPTLTYVRVLDAIQQQGSNIVDIAVDGNIITVLESGQPATRHEVAHVFERGISDEYFCESTIGQEAGASLGANLNPISAVIEDASTAVIMLVGSNNTKKWQFLKRIFLPFLANEFFACIHDKEDHRAHHGHGQGHEFYQYRISLNAFEIQDEIITDLLSPANRGLTISISPDNGVNIPGLDTEVIKSEEHLRQLLVDTCDNRVSHILPPGASIDTSSAIWNIIIEQREGDNGIVLVNKSRIVIVDVPSVNPLLIPSSDIRLLEGPNLHRSIYTFADISRKLASPSLVALAPFRTSKLTHYLSELLGGNSIVVALGLIHPGEASVTRKTLEILDNLTCARHYPISGKEMSELVQGLLMKYRSMVLNAQDESQLGILSSTSASQLTKKDGNGKVTSGDQDEEAKELISSLEEKISLLQQELASSKLELSKSKTDTLQVYELLELLKSKYATLLELKSQQSEELVVAEGEKLELARALLELKMNHSHEMEEVEKTKFELTTQIVALKNELNRIDDESQIAHAELIETKEKLTSTINQYNAERDARVEVATQLADARAVITKLEERNLELGAELVTLINTREILERDLSDLRKAKVELEKVLSNEDNDILALRAKNQELEDQILGMQSLTSSTQQSLLESQFELKRLNLELEKSKLDFEKSAGEYLKGKEITLKKEAQAIQQELSHLTYEKEQLAIALRREERKNRDLKREKERQGNDKEELQRQLLSTISQLDDVKEKYRFHLSAELAQGPPPNTSRAIGTFTHRSIQESNLSWEHIIESYANQEKVMQTSLSSVILEKEKMLGSYRALYDQYRKVIDIIQDHCPNVLPSNILSSENDPFLNQLVNSNQNQVQNLMAVPMETRKQQSPPQISLQHPPPEEVSQQQVSQIKKLEADLLKQKEEVTLVVSKYKSSLEKLDRKVSQLTEERNFLKEKCSYILDTTNKLTLNNEEGNRVILRSMYNFLEDALDEIRAHYEGDRNGKAPPKELKDLKTLEKQLKTVTRQCRTLEDENANLRQKVVHYQQSASQRTNEVKSLFQPQGQANVGGSDGGSGNNTAALLNLMREMESRNASLTARNASLEEELKNYKEYMKKTISDYKSQISHLRAELSLINNVAETVNRQKKKPIGGGVNEYEGVPDKEDGGHGGYGYRQSNSARSSVSRASLDLDQYDKQNKNKNPTFPAITK